MDKQDLELKREGANFKKYKGQIKKLYSDERTILEAGGRTLSYASPSTLNTREKQLQIIEDSLRDVNRAVRMSETLEATNGTYGEIIRYYSTLPLYRYTVVPAQTRKLNENTVTDKYKKYYDSMLRIVDGISIEVNFPKILEIGLIEGTVYLYASKDQKSETIETFMLPNAYCQKGFSTNFGTESVIFDFDFFKKLYSDLTGGSTGLVITEEDFFNLFPKELMDQYNAYLKDRTLRFQSLDPRFGAAIPFSRSGIPPKITANYGVEDYKVIKKNEIKRSLNELEKILIHKIPHLPGDGSLIFEVDEALQLHDSMARALRGVSDLKLLTVFGDIDLVELQKDRTKENKTLQQAHDNVFYEAGLNPGIFKGDTPAAIKTTLAKDSAYVFKQLDLIVNFYNLVINNLYNFGPYEARINLLKISVYDEAEKVKQYLESATFGIGKLEAIIASGMKQRDIGDKHKLEEFLELDKILVPLQSSHTSTPDQISQEPEEQPNDEQSEVENEEPDDTNEEVDT